MCLFQIRRRFAHLLSLSTFFFFLILFFHFVSQITDPFHHGDRNDFANLFWSVFSLVLHYSSSPQRPRTRGQRISADRCPNTSRVCKWTHSRCNQHSCLGRFQSNERIWRQIETRRDLLPKRNSKCHGCIGLEMERIHCR